MTNAMLIKGVELDALLFFPLMRSESVCFLGIPKGRHPSSQLQGLRGGRKVSINIIDLQVKDPGMS